MRCCCCSLALMRSRKEGPPLETGAAALLLKLLDDRRCTAADGGRLFVMLLLFCGAEAEAVEAERVALDRRGSTWLLAAVSAASAAAAGALRLAAVALVVAWRFGPVDSGGVLARRDIRAALVFALCVRTSQQCISQRAFDAGRLASVHAKRLGYSGPLF